MQDYKILVEDFIQKNILSKTGESYFFPNEEDGLYYELDFIGKILCRKYIKGQSSFYLIDSCRVQAGAIHKYHAVLVFKGMLELIFRTSAMMVGAERRQNEPDGVFYEPWRNNLSLWINGGKFDWENEEYWWLHDPMHKKVFDMLVEAMFIFLVLHEIGHFHNLHGERRHERTTENPSLMEHLVFIHKAVSDSGDVDEVDEAGKLDAHAREIIADTYAFQFMLQELKECFFPVSEYKGADVGALSAANFAICIYAVASFFWALSFQRPMRNDTQKDHYPSHAFRLSSIEAASLEHKVCRRDSALTRSGLEAGMKSYTSKLTCAANNNEFVEWRLSMSIPANQKHYEKICAITANWSNLMFGVRDEEWLKS
ncbi:hypothetical protein [Pectobacterium brasiliense]|uniref:hypothetical protein n=1 Tax=Pectobacterium brasiliense TaxID=180957 RepID=UPI0039857183